MVFPIQYHRSIIYPLDGTSRTNFRGNVGEGMEVTMIAVDVRHLHFRYHDNHVALRDVSLEIQEGESVGLIGPNGAGKSTFLMHLNGILPESPADKPCVMIHGTPVNEKNLLQIRREVGLLFQDPDDQLFCPTVYEDVAFGPVQFGIPENEVKKLVKEALEKVGLRGFEKRSPHHLSSGEKQRVCLAGILVSNPKILALDEPTRALDPRGKRKLKELLENIQATKIVATHDLELVAEICSRAVVMDEGKIVADGPTMEILGNEELMLAHGLEKPHILKHRHPH
ncbi:MAG: energy-coupling factor ABC transporter ATP-binding protein [Bacteroidota bacterium]